MNLIENDKTSMKMTTKCLSMCYAYQALQHSFSPSVPFAVYILLSSLELLYTLTPPPEWELLLEAAQAYSHPQGSANAVPQEHTPARPFPCTASTKARRAAAGAGPA